MRLSVCVVAQVAQKSPRPIFKAMPKTGRMRVIGKATTCPPNISNIDIRNNSKEGLEKCLKKDIALPMPQGSR